MTVHLNDDQARELGLERYIPKKVARRNDDPDGMNRTERRYADRLDLLIARGVILEYWFERVKFRLGEKCFYTPDFLVKFHDGELEIHEIKGGYIREDSLVKLKAAAAAFPLPFVLCQWVGAEWSFRSIGGR